MEEGEEVDEEAVGEHLWGGRGKKGGGRLEAGDEDAVRMRWLFLGKCPASTLPHTDLPPYPPPCARAR